MGTDHRKQRGAVLVLVAVLLTGFLALAALVIDIGNMHVVGNELQNAADAGALAGAHELVNEDMTINTSRVHELADEAAMKNLNGMNGVAIKSIRIGHWTFPNGPFQENNNPYQLSTEPVPDLNSDPDFINAVEVTVTRSDAHLAFARLFYPGYQREKTAVAYVGSYPPGMFEHPLAWCRATLNLDADGNPSCQSFRASNDHTDTGGWTNYAQPCGAEGPNPKEFVCVDGNPRPVFPGGVKVPPGQVNAAFKAFSDCWEGNPSLDLLKSDGTSGQDKIPDQPWVMTVPVFNCDGGKVSSCEEIIGTVTVQVVWISDPGGSLSGKKFPNVPPVMAKPGVEPPWIRPEGLPDEEAWKVFAKEFDLDGGNAPFNTKQIYVLPSCQFEPASAGMLSGPDQIPVLVK
jgi:hypothetical protein